MRLDEAYQQWGSQSENRELYKNTKDLFRKATWLLPTNKPCSYYTLEVLGRALAQTTMASGDKAKAASVICHVLNFAHDTDAEANPKPAFDYDALTHYVGKAKTDAPAEKPEVTAETETQEPDDDPAPVMVPSAREVVQLDPKTLKQIRTWRSATAAGKELGIQNIQRAIDRHGLAGGYFWCRPEDVDGFQPTTGSRTNAGRKPATKKSKPVSRRPVSVPQPEKPVLQADNAPTLADFSDEELLAEIRRREWKGRLTITKTVEL